MDCALRLSGLSDLERRFLRDDITANSERRDRDFESIPRSLLLEGPGSSLLCRSLPIECGGGGADARDWGQLLMNVGEATCDSSFALLLGLHAAVAEAVWEHAGPGLRETHGKPLASGKRLGAFCYTEHADAFNFATTVEERGDRLALQGEKVMITGGVQADCFVVYARMSTGDLAAVVVDRSDHGVQLRELTTSGLRAAGLAALTLDCVDVSVERMLVRRDALTQVQGFLNRRRILLSCAPIGRMRALLRQVVTHLEPRVRYGQPVLEMEHVKARLGRMSARVRTAELVVRSVLDDLVGGRCNPVWDEGVVAAKYLVAETAQQVAGDALRLLGGDGYLCAFPFERAQRDFTGLLAGAGAQDLLEVSLGAALTTRIRMEER